jgi:Spy/CpxP family protein refolding chaperone
MNFRNKVLAAVAAVALTTGAFAAADQVGERKAGRRGAGFAARGHFMDRIATQLQLTEAQKQYAQTLFRENREAAKPVMQQLRQGREAMAAAVKADNEAEITRLAGEQAQLMAQVRALHAKGLAKFYAQLTAEQKAKADEMFNRLQNRFGQGGRRG